MNEQMNELVIQYPVWSFNRWSLRREEGYRRALKSSHVRVALN